MPNRLSPALVRGARGMLDWSMVDLAEAARISVSTVKRVEGGAPHSVSDDVHGLIQDAFETEGVRFLPDHGHGEGLQMLRRRPKAAGDPGRT